MTFAIKKYITLHIAVRMRKKLLSGIKMLNMDFILAFAEDHVPSTKAFDPYMHLFLDAGQGNVLAFLNCQPNQKWAVMKIRLNGCNILPLKLKI